VIVVLDANTVIAGLLSSQGACAEILDRWREGQFEVAVCPAFISELERVLQYPRIVRRYNIAADASAAALAELRDQGEHFPDTVDPPRLVPDDENDDYVLALADAAAAGIVVTRDKHFAAVDPALCRAEIVSPEEFLSRLREGEAGSTEPQIGE
jgi:putative PIN family toxin of toxin-antitoxin system